MEYLAEYPLGGGSRAAINADTLPGYAGLYALCHSDASNDEWKDRCTTMTIWLKRYRINSLFKKLRVAALMRSIAVYCFKEAMETA